METRVSTRILSQMSKLRLSIHERSGNECSQRNHLSDTLFTHAESAPMESFLQMRRHDCHNNMLCQELPPTICSRTAGLAAKLCHSSTCC